VVITSSNGTTQLVPLPTTSQSHNKGSINKDLFPKFNGDGDNFPLWITQVDAVLESSCWKNITPNTVTATTNAHRSKVFHVALLKYLSKDSLFLLQNDAAYRGWGIEMRLRLTHKFQPTGVEALFDILSKFFAFKQASRKSTAIFAAQMRIMSTRSATASQEITPTLQVLATLLGLDQQQFGNLHATFENGTLD